MPDTTNFKALVSEWRLVLRALDSYKTMLDSKVDSIDDEDKQNEMYDDLERLERLIPDFQSQFNDNL
jgi:hypothetical protein